ncbi:MAG TPA: winged helix DNA-binding domain-containing protein [Chloroflexia bacterium]|nr:winged helix DNA-binding domain-containing protein [Chloroflexia bacterium]
MNIAYQRLQNQQIAQHQFAAPHEVVAWLGAVQAQDYGAAKWAVGLRLPGCTDAAVAQAVADGTILRTHILRPTWHFVAPTDIRWMLALTAPRVHALNAYWYRKLELDDALFRRIHAALEAALRGGRQLTRPEIATVLRRAGIPSEDVQPRFAYIMMHAELEGLVCSGGMRGKQFTYSLLEERAPPAATLSRDEALATLTARYFHSRGPATLADFVWWSGLTMADARAGLALVQSQLVQDDVAGETYWLPPTTGDSGDISLKVFLLPNFDEYTVGYADRSAVFNTADTTKLGPRASILFSHTIVVEGQVAGIWKRTIKRQGVIVETEPFSPLDADEARCLDAAVAQYGAFLNVPVLGGV